jgi:hypothetical protein
MAAVPFPVILCPCSTLVLRIMTQSGCWLLDAIKECAGFLPNVIGAAGVVNGP